MSYEAVTYVNRHYVARPAAVPVATWVEAQAILQYIATMSDPSGHGCTASQTTIGQRFSLDRRRVNELVRVLLGAHQLEKEPGRRAYIVVGVRDHNPLECGHAWCEKEARTIFRRGQRDRAKAKRGSLATAAAESAATVAFMAEWDREREAM